MCSLHRGYYSHCHTAPYYATPPPALAAELLAPPPSPPWPGPRCGAGAGWRPLAVCGVCTSVQASPATATLAGHQPPVCCDHRPLVWAVVWWRPAPGPAEPPAGRSPPLHSSTSQWRSYTLSSPWPPPCHSSPSPGHTMPCLSLSSLAWPCRDTPPTKPMHILQCWRFRINLPPSLFHIFCTGKAPRSPAPDRVLSTLSLISINDQFLFRHE